MANSDKEKNIQIPLSLFNRIVKLMDSLDTTDFDPLLLIMYNAVQLGLRTKRISIETLFALFDAPHLNALLNKPFHNKRRFIILAA